MDELQLITNAIKYLNDTKKDFINQYTTNIKPLDNKVAIFTAGMSGVGKTEFSQFLKENNKDLLHIDTDTIREYFKPVGYDGQNSNLFQKPASKGFSKLFDYAIKNKLSLILDSNLSNILQAVDNIERLLNKNYKIEIFYLYNNPTICYQYAIKREVITNRKVPYDIFVTSNINSYKTVLELKNIFDDKIILHYIDKKTDIIHKDITIEKLKKEVGVYFDTN